MENHWPAGVHVKWDTGVPDGRPEKLPGKHTHCSAPGHIAIVRPSDKGDAALREEGPQITQAGGTNYRSIALRVGFAGHPAASSRHEVRFYAHAVDAVR